MDSINLSSYLDTLPQPAVVLDLSSSSPESASICYVNPTFVGIISADHGTEKVESAGFVGQQFVDVLQSQLISSSSASFLQWISGITTENNYTPFRTQFKSATKPVNIKWTGAVVQTKYIVLTGRIRSPSSPERSSRLPVGNLRNEDITPPPSSTDSVHRSTSPVISRRNSPAGQQESQSTWRNQEKFTKNFAGGGMMGDLLRQKDWASTELGPVESWSQALLTVSSLMMASTFPMSLWWGPNNIVLYNDGYVPFIAEKHPSLYGTRAKDGFEELWDILGEVADAVRTGQSTYSEDQCLMLLRHGFLEETYFTYGFLPVREETGDVGGLLARTNPLKKYLTCLACFESTNGVLAARRLKTLRELDTHTANARTLDQLGKSIGKAFTFNPYDVPFALTYFCSSDISGSTSTSDDGTERSIWTFHLQNAVGIPDGDPLAPSVVEVHLHHDQGEAHVWPFREMVENQEQIHIHDLSPETLSSIKPQGWPELPKEAIAMPILGARDVDGREILLGMLVLGINPRRKFDESYEEFSTMSARQISAAMITVRSIEEEAARLAELTALNRDRTAFFNSVSHELRTPLTLILGPLDECLEDPDMSKEHRSRLDMMSRNARRLLRLVNSLLDFTRVEAGKMNVSFRETNLQKYTADLASLFRSAIEKGGVEYIVDMSGKEHPVWVDRDMWEKIVFNLVGNAFKFTLSGQIIVSCCLSDDNHHMQLSIQDTGTGIPPNELDRIFEKFHTVQHQQSRSGEGSGIGLALTQELVKLHGGRIEVESTYGEGTTFTVFIPIGNAHLSREKLFTGDTFEMEDFKVRVYGRSVIEEADQWVRRPESPKTTFPNDPFVSLATHGSRILVVDDNEDMRVYVKGILSPYYTVIGAANAEDAHQMALADPPDMIICDIMMPGLDGYGTSSPRVLMAEFLQLIRTSPTTNLMPFILLSARAGDEARVAGLTAGADDYLAKPFSGKELLARVHAHLDIARMRTKLEDRVKERTRDLLESEARYRIITAISPVGIFRTDKAGTVLYGNQKLWEITGGTGIGETLGSLVHPDDHSMMCGRWREAREKNEDFQFEARWGTRESFHWAMGEVVPEIIDDDVFGFIGVLTDVTERREREAQKLRAAEEVRAQQELAIDVIFHEMRNPLNAIYQSGDIVHESISKMLEEIINFGKPARTSDLDVTSLTHLLEFLQDELEMDVDSMKSLNLCAKHQKRIADDILQISKLSLNLVSLSETPFEPLEETKGAIRMLERSASAKGIDITFRLGEQYKELRVDWVKADPIRFTQVLVNFISNAIRFTENAPTRNIEITLEASEELPDLPNSLIETSGIQQGSTVDDENPMFLVVSVKDTGVGLTPEERGNLFQKFRQASPKTYSQYGGSGLGLFISKALVEVQGGRISLQSEKGKGTTVSFYIRCSRSAAPPEPPRLSRQQSRRWIKSRRDPDSPTTVPLNILVVEDDMINQKVLTRQLQLLGHHAAVASNGLECLKQLEKDGDNFDLILMDIEMPVLNGFEATKEIRRREATGELPGHTPIIAVSGNARSEYVEKASSIGIEGFIKKPYEKQDLIKKIHLFTATQYQE